MLGKDNFERQNRNSLYERVTTPRHGLTESKIVSRYSRFLTLLNRHGPSIRPLGPSNKTRHDLSLVLLLSTLVSPHYSLSRFVSSFEYLRRCLQSSSCAELNNDAQPL